LAVLAELLVVQAQLLQVLGQLQATVVLVMDLV
jgi:hypothetical protein